MRCTLWRVRPRLAICGHVHESRGSQIVQWDLDNSNIKYKESGVIQWQDPGKEKHKLSAVDLTHRGARPLANDGSVSNAFDGNQSAGPNPENTQTQLMTDAIPPLPTEGSSLATLGQGGSPTSSHSDVGALLGRMGRKETCIVNASIMASGYPHKGGKRFNKPIVVDIDLPVWEGE